LVIVGVVTVVAPIQDSGKVKSPYNLLMIPDVAEVTKVYPFNKLKLP
jgi:hypothetical protein